MSGLVTDEMMAESVHAAGLSMEGAKPGPAALASPSYMALESRSVVIGSAFVKRMHPEMMDGFDLDAAMQTAAQAGQAGVGPELRWQDSGTGAVAMQALGEGWHTARQASLQDPETLAASMRAIKVLHSTDAINARFNPFARIDALIDGLEGVGAALPDDIMWLRRLVAQIEPLCDSVNTAPCRNDGSASNLMLGPDGAVLLVDFDRAGMNDPMYDVGCLLAEVTDFERDMYAGFIAYLGHFDEAAFARARLWSHVDDLLHALWARLHARTSQRSAVEWLKYGEWRLIRVRMALMHPQFEEKIRMAGAVA